MRLHTHTIVCIKSKGKRNGGVVEADDTAFITIYFNSFGELDGVGR